MNLTTLKRIGALRYAELKDIKGLCFSADGRSLAGFTSGGTSNGSSGPKSSDNSSAAETVILYWNLDKLSVRLFGSDRL